MGEFSSALRCQVLTWLNNNVPESRVEHVLRVEQMAIELACLHGLDASKAAQAGLMHDLAKYFKPKILLEIAEANAIPIDPVDRSNPHLLHAEVSALVACQQFSITDQEILAAISNHTLGRPAMSDLSCVVFLADSLEPGRSRTAELDLLRQISRQDLTQAVWKTCDYTLTHVIQKQSLVHPRAIATRNWFLQCSRSGLATVNDPDRGPDQFLTLIPSQRGG